MILLLRRAAILLVLALLAAPLPADPQHWGFGFGYLVVLEDGPGGRVLSAWAPPLRVKDGPWLLRWRDAGGEYGAVLPRGLAAGDFLPEPMGKERLAAIERGAGGLAFRLLDPPEVFSDRTWRTALEGALDGSGLDDPAGSFLAAAALRVEAGGPDRLVTLHRQGGGHRLRLYAPFAPGAAVLQLAGTAELGPVPGGAAGLAAGDFWGTGRDGLALLDGEGTLHYLELEGTEGALAAIPRAVDRLGEAGRNRPLLAAADFLKDGFAYMALGDEAGGLRFRLAPRRPERYRTIWVRPDETFAGARLPGQEIGAGAWTMAGSRQAPAGRVVAAAAGRIFGYVIPGCDERKEKLWLPWRYQGRPDLEISFVERTPVYRLGVPKEWQDGDWPWEPDGHYGWPFQGEPVTCRIHVKNNGREAVPAGAARLLVWHDARERNADLLRPPDAVIPLAEAIPPFDPERPEYTVKEVAFPWPFALIQPPGWTWKRIDVRERGERWFVARLAWAGDENERNDRCELALNALLFRPVFRRDAEVNTLAFRAPTVRGDPESKEYIARKLADAVQCMWERSRTSAGEDVLQRVAFVGYRLGWPCRRDLDWSFYEGSRELQKWIGLWGDFERFDPGDGEAELHETGHLFQCLGDLYPYFVFPSQTRLIRMADGTPVQMHTWAWGRDSFCDGQAIMGEGAADLHRYLEGARFGLGFPWHRMLPDRVKVRVLDRDGRPVPGARVTLWTCPQAKAEAAGTTGPDGSWDTGLPRGKRVLFDPFGIPLHEDPIYDALAFVATVDLPGYADCGILGAEDVCAHSRYTLMARSITHRAGWTWDMPTLWRAGAPPPDFAVEAVVDGRQVALRMEGPPGARYRIRRRWEPSYTFEEIGMAEAAGPAAAFRDDLGAPDWFKEGRHRATYYVTRTDGPAETLPRRVDAFGAENAHGLSDLGGGRLLVALNCGHAEPFGAVFRGTTPAEELLRHFRFGHTAARIVRSRENPERYYATLVFSDLDPEWSRPRSFDLIQFDRPDRIEARHHVLHTIAAEDVASFTGAAPWRAVLAREDPEAPAPVLPGDLAVNAGDEGRRARILAVDGLELTLDGPLFRPGEESPRLHIEQVAGGEGDGTATRELCGPRGLDVVRAGGRELVAIADHGNGRVVLWDARTRFVAAWSAPGLKPAAAAAHPREEGVFFVLDRRAEGGSRLWTLRTDGRDLRDRGTPFPLPVGDSPAGPEIGLAAVAEPGTGRLLLAVTDGARGRVLVLAETPAGWREEAVLARALAPVDPVLRNPTDAAWTVADGRAMLFVVDDHRRVVRVR